MSFDGAKQIPDISDQVQTFVEETVVGDVTTTYVGVAKPTADIDTSDWAVRRIIEDASGATVTTEVKWAKKDFGDGLESTARFVHPRDDMAGLTY